MFYYIFLIILSKLFILNNFSFTIDKSGYSLIIRVSKGTKGYYEKRT